MRAFEQTSKIFRDMSTATEKMAASTEEIDGSAQRVHRELLLPYSPFPQWLVRMPLLPRKYRPGARASEEIASSAGALDLLGRVLEQAVAKVCL